MKESPLRDGLETTLKKVANEIRERAKGAPKALETPLKQATEVVHNAVAFGSEIVRKKTGRKTTSAKKRNVRKTRSKKTSATKTSARKTSSAKRGAKKIGRKKRAGTKS